MDVQTQVNERTTEEKEERLKRVREQERERSRDEVEVGETKRSSTTQNRKSVTLARRPIEASVAAQENAFIGRELAGCAWYQ